MQKLSSAIVECSNTEQVFNEQVFLGKKGKWWKQAKLHSSMKWPSISWSHDLLLTLFYIQFTLHPKLPFPNKQCCRYSLSWDSLLKLPPFPSLLLGSTKQTLTTVEQMFSLKRFQSQAQTYPNQNKTPTPETDLLDWVLWDKSTFWVSLHIFVKLPLEGCGGVFCLFVCCFLFKGGVRKFFPVVSPSVTQMLMLGRF